MLLEGAAILAVDDCRDTVRTVRLILEKNGSEVQSTTSPYDAIALLEANPVDLALIDMKMPGRSGLELADEIRQRWPETSIILMTAYPDIKSAVAAGKVGVDDYITKPFREEELVSLVEEALKDRRLAREGEMARCFISYSTNDEPFATKLRGDFEAAGIQCWKWNEDARTGDSLWAEIDTAIREHGKMVLIASESSLRSPAVLREIERAIREEDERHKRKLAGDFHGDVSVLFPVRLDDYIFADWNHELKVDVTKRVIADARGWDSDPPLYKEILQRLIRHLKSRHIGPRTET